MLSFILPTNLPLYVVRIFLLLKQRVVWTFYFLKEWPMKRVFNFSAGPAMLPEAVLQTARAEMLDWHDSGMSLMEMSHRSPAFMELCAQTEQLLRQLMHIPSNYHVLFLSGGARSQFAMVPMNLLAENKKANYLITGSWSQLAYTEAKKYGAITITASGENENFTTVPEQSGWNVAANARYFYYTPNETIHGVEVPFIPAVGLPLVADMTSCILSREFPIEKFGVIFAAAQKNLSQAGVTVVIIREDLISEPLPFTPSMFDYRCHRDSHSLYNTAPTYAIYIMNLVLQDLKDQGGVAVIRKRNFEKASLLYRFIDNSNFYHNNIDPQYRSTMNVTFRLPTAALEKRFIVEAAQHDLLNLKGHSRVGGIRASIYNAMPLAGVEALVHFMQLFQEKYVTLSV